MSNSLPKVILVGKPNVGKSTLFNTIIGKKEAIVGKEIGLTRDYQEVKYILENNQISLFDTAGLRINSPKKSKVFHEHTLEKIRIADIIFFLIDGSNELTSEDYNCADSLRKYKKKVILLVNKVELKQSKNFENLGYELGFGNPVGITGKSKSAKLIINNIIKKFLNTSFFNEKDTSKIINKKKQEKISLSISGKPNTGKSTIFNNIFGSNRVMIGSEAGTTRDSVKEEIVYDNCLFDLVDTAGIKKKTKAYKNEVDRSTNYFSRKEIRYANIVMLVFDANMPFTNLELSLANFIISEGRAVLLVFNKWDLVSEKEKIKKEIISKINSYFFDIKDVPAVFISALNKNCKNIILNQVESIYFKWNKKIKTSTLNQWLHSEFMNESSQNSKTYIPIKFRYISQIKNRPPTFLLFCNTKKKFNDAKLRSFKNRLRKKFHLEGIPIRINIKVSNNPYKKN
ncbi:MAG: GTPase Der [Alphaproteobacteria bacterium MarineAlpha9_Bin4]|nr:MAG: GTPase Der [Alphaproteobacteria bacterium MarineAlpha9_Bin4]